MLFVSTILLKTFSFVCGPHATHTKKNISHVLLNYMFARFHYLFLYITYTLAVPAVDVGNKRCTIFDPDGGNLNREHTRYSSYVEDYSPCCTGGLSAANAIGSSVFSNGQKVVIETGTIRRLYTIPISLLLYLTPSSASQKLT